MPPNDTKKPLRVLLIKCVRHEEHFSVTQPLGAMYLASYLRERGDYEIKIIDMRPRLTQPEEVERLAKEFQPDLVGFSALTVEAPSMNDVAQRLNRAFPNVPFIAGGPHASSATERCLKDGPIDLAVVGEGEESFGEIVDAVESGQPLREIPGTAWLEDDQVVMGPQRDGLKDVDALPFPAWDLIDIDAYNYLWRFSQTDLGPYMSLFTSRACPYKCIYCHDLFGKEFRARSVPNVIAEMKKLEARYGINTFEIVDDIFNFNKSRVHEFCAEIKRQNMKVRFTFPNGLRVDILDKETIEMMAEAGCYFIAFAIESANERVQKVIKKYNHMDRIEANITHAANAGIFTHGFFIIGFPTETLEEIHQTLDFAARSKLHTAGMFLANPFEGTELERIAREQGYDTQRTYNDYGYYSTRVNMTAAPEADLQKILQRGVRRFYLQPSRIWRIFRDHPNRKVFLMQGFHFLNRAFGVKVWKDRLSTPAPLDSTPPQIASKTA